MRDARFRPEAPGSSCTAPEIAEWRHAAEAFLTAQSTSEKTVLPKGTWHRIASYDLLCGLDWQLTVCAGTGWNAFDSNLQLDFPIHKRMRATMVWDKGPDNLCVTGYLLNKKRLRASFFFSPAHGVQRAMWNGVQAAGKGSVLYVATAVVNLERGPFHGEADWQQIRESTIEWKAKATSDRQDPILKLLMPAIKLERGGDPLDITDADIDDVVENIDSSNFYLRKPKKDGAHAVEYAER